MRPLNVSAEPFFSDLVAGGDYLISPMMLGEGTQATGYVVAKRLTNNGTFAGVAAVSISNQMLAEVWRSLDLDDGSAISLVRNDGWIVARHPAPAEVSTLIDYELFTEHLARAPQGTYLAEASPVDGARRIVGYRTLDTIPLVAIAALSTDAAMARFWQNVAIVLALIIPGLGGMLAALGWLLRILKRDRKTREKLAEAVEKNHVLFREIHHRVKNNLQAVSSLVQLQPVPAAVKGEMGRRIAAMVAVHEHI
ncbi:histidine kinase dimerization/phosphoacceptor domain -containing protein [Pelagibacterium luteolum]|nr:histidine kinase dimerization/phosphoacceptor domain -containing protein [Pelagibacterium luteolum]